MEANNWTLKDFTIANAAARKIQAAFRGYQIRKLQNHISVYARVRPFLPYEYQESAVHVEGKKLGFKGETPKSRSSSSDTSSSPAGRTSTSSTGSAPPKSTILP